MLYHITYTDRLTGRTETGRVSVANNHCASAATMRRSAIVVAGWKYPNAQRATISAVAVRRPV